MAVPLMFQPLAKYAQFEGRSRRSEFWLWVLFRFIVSATMGVIAFAMLAPVFSAIAAQRNMDEAHSFALMANVFRIYPLYMLVGLGLLVPTLAVAVRRLHDINRSGLWLLMPLGVAIGGLILLVIAGVILAVSVGVAAHQGAQPTTAEGFAGIAGVFIAYIVYGLAVFAAEIVLFVFFVTEGSKGENRFGADPKATI